MKLFIIRHAQSANNVLETENYDYYMRNRVVDPSITEIGVRQADRLADYLAGFLDKTGGLAGDNHLASHFNFTHIYASPMLRTLQTAWSISQALGMKPEVWVDIHEQGGMFLGNPRAGEEVRGYPGMTRSEILARFPGYMLPENVTAQGWWQGIYEDDEGCKLRANRVAAELTRQASERPNDRLAIITHGTFADRLIKALSGAPGDRGAHYFHHYNTAISRVDFWPERGTSFRYLNRIEHLPLELITA